MSVEMHGDLFSNDSTWMDPNDRSRSYYQSVVEKSMSLNGTLSFIEANFNSEKGFVINNEDEVI